MIVSSFDPSTKKPTRSPPLSSYPTEFRRAFEPLRESIHIVSIANFFIVIRYQLAYYAAELAASLALLSAAAFDSIICGSGGVKKLIVSGKCSNTKRGFAPLSRSFSMCSNT